MRRRDTAQRKRTLANGPHSSTTALRPLLLWGALVLSLLTARPALAWTETMVTGARADVHLAEDGVVEVVMTANLRITGGWLSLFELDGLPPDLTLIADDPVTITPEAEGPMRLPKAEVLRGGRVRLTFARRRDAPRRGRYLLRLPFTARVDLATAQRPTAETVRIPFQLPAWESGIEGAEVRISAPAGSVTVNHNPQVHARVEQGEDGRPQLVFTRAQLPRTVPLAVAIDVPVRALRGVPLGEDGPTLRSLAGREKPAPTLPPFHLWTACLALLKLIASAVRARQLRIAPRYLLPGLPLWLRVLALGACALVPERWVLSPLPWLLCGAVVPVALVLERRGLRRTAPRGLRARPATHAELRALRLSTLLHNFDFPALFDLTTPAGGLVALSLALVGFMLVRSSADPAGLITALLPLLALFLSGTRRAQPAAMGEHARMLLAAQQQLPVASGTILHYAPRLGDPPAELRLSLALERPVEGLHQASLALGTLRWLDRDLEGLCWLLLVDEHSDADERARVALPSATRRRHKGLGRIAYLAPAHDLPREHAALLGWLSSPRESEERGTHARAA